MTKLWLSASLLAFAAPAHAAPVTFQSGEHAGFTRLVATLPSSDTEWSLTGSGRSYTFKVEGQDIAFDTSLP